MKYQDVSKLLLIIAVILAGAGQAFCLDPDAVSRLKAAGAGDAVIEALVREKSIETAAFTVEGIVKMKTAGVGDPSLVRMIEEKSFSRGKKTVTYGQAIRPATRATIKDIMDLKSAGISDDVIHAIIKHQSIDPNVEEQRRVLEMLKDMNLFLDVRDP